MNEPNDPQELNLVYNEACRLIDGLLILGETTSLPFDELGRHRLETAILLLSTVIHFNPDHWPALWLLGKAHERLGQTEQAFHHFRLANACNPDHPDILRETAIAALELGLSTEAVEYCLHAAKIVPDDAGLLANLSLALLFSERLSEAMDVAKRAFVLDPNDGMIGRILTIVNEVIQGLRLCPKHVRDLK